MSNAPVPVKWIPILMVSLIVLLILVFVITGTN
jgi:hypothetical protein